MSDKYTNRGNHTRYKKMKILETAAKNQTYVLAEGNFTSMHKTQGKKSYHKGQLIPWQEYKDLSDFYFYETTSKKK